MDLIQKWGIQTIERRIHKPLINPNQVKVRQYKNVEELNRARGEKPYLTEEEHKVIERNKKLEKEREQERLMRE